MDFTGKVILITGASTGIGKALALSLSKENCKLVLVARRTELIEQYKQQFTAHQPLIIKCDVSNKEEVTKTNKEIVERFGGIDIAILNAGVGFHMDVEKYNSMYAEKTFGTNLYGVIYWVEQILPYLLKKKEGVIAGISSLADNRGYSKSGFYSSSKAALTNYLEGLSLDLKPYGIKVITIRPGFVDTPINSQNKYPMPFMMNAESAAEIILNGIKSEKRMIQFPWQMVLLTRLIGSVPGRLYEWLVSRSKL
ncbi:MAG: SDR family NAD(P)-dependent oxidoreductase [Bacteroidota bacterium]